MTIFPEKVTVEPDVPLWGITLMPEEAIVEKRVVVICLRCEGNTEMLVMRGLNSSSSRNLKLLESSILVNCEEDIATTVIHTVADIAGITISRDQVVVLKEIFNKEFSVHKYFCLVEISVNQFIEHRPFKEGLMVSFMTYRNIITHADFDPAHKNLVREHWEILSSKKGRHKQA